MVNVGKREDALLDALSEKRDRIDNALAILEEAIIAKPGDAILDRIWFALKCDVRQS